MAFEPQLIQALILLVSANTTDSSTLTTHEVVELIEPKPASQFFWGVPTALCLRNDASSYNSQHRTTVVRVNPGEERGRGKHIGERCSSELEYVSNYSMSISITGEMVIYMLPCVQSIGVELGVQAARLVVDLDERPLGAKLNSTRDQSLRKVSLNTPIHVEVLLLTLSLVFVTFCSRLRTKSVPKSGDCTIA